VALPVNPPFEPMLAKLTRELPTSAEGVIFEPKWDGFRCLVFRDGDHLDLQSRNKKPLLRYFPEMREPLLAQLPERVVLDGELVVAREKGLDFDALQLRQHPADSRVQKLAKEIPASYVAFDVLALGDESLLDTPFAQRRATLEQILKKAKAPLHCTPTTDDLETAADWFERFEGAGFDGIVAKPLDGLYQPGKRTMIKVKHERTCDCVVAGFRVHKDGNGVGSLLLGLYDDDGGLHHVGVASGMNAKLRTQLRSEVEPLRKNALDDHPWKDWADFMREAAESGPDGPRSRMPGGPSRWNANKDLSWEPLRIESVVEAEFEGMLSGRFRHNARFRRWRPDKDPRDCTYDQLETIPPAELREMFGS
jgi:ATP-dependent DNA ligase